MRRALGLLALLPTLALAVTEAYEVPAKLVEKSALVKLQIDFMRGDDFRGRSMCSGTLLDARTVLTAAHCVVKRPGHDAQGVRLDVSVIQGSRSVAVKAWKIYPGVEELIRLYRTEHSGPWTEEMRLNLAAYDVAVLRLSEGLEAKYPQLADRLPQEGARVFLGGYGGTDFEAYEDHERPEGFDYDVVNQSETLHVAPQVLLHSRQGALTIPTVEAMIRPSEANLAVPLLVNPCRGEYEDAQKSALLPGDSGSALLDANHQIVGVFSTFEVGGTRSGRITNFFATVTREETRSFIERVHKTLSQEDTP